MTRGAHRLEEWRSEGANASATPVLSVLIPFKGDDPGPLFDALAGELSGEEGERVELILYDDGSRSPALLGPIARRVSDAAFSARLISDEANRGRSTARNRLFSAARAGHVLFLDADMLPERAEFLSDWLRLIEEKNVGVAFGGFTVARAPGSRDAALHKAFAASSECSDAARRAAEPEKFVFTSNLLVRRDVLDATPFDDGFTGWGWEDVDWGARVARMTPIHHVDNPAIHLGLEPAQALLDKFRGSAANFARFVERNPTLAGGLPCYRAARFFAEHPALARLRPVFASLARDRAGAAPMTARVLALKLWRASWYGEALR